MPHMEEKIDIICGLINTFPIAPARQEDIKDKIRDFGMEEWNRGYDKALYNEACCDRSERGTREDLQDQIDDLQQQVGELQFLTAELKEKSGDILDAIGWERYKKEYLVKFQSIDSEGVSYPTQMTVHAKDRWFAENLVKISFPKAHDFTFYTQTEA
jgi:hypothetical protein